MSRSSRQWRKRPRRKVGMRTFVRREFAAKPPFGAAFLLGLLALASRLKPKLCRRKPELAGVFGLLPSSRVAVVSG
jgi:hypothetical protein